MTGWDRSRWAWLEEGPGACPGRGSAHPLLPGPAPRPSPQCSAHLGPSNGVAGYGLGPLDSEPQTGLPSSNCSCTGERKGASLHPGSPPAGCRCSGGHQPLSSSGLDLDTRGLLVPEQLLTPLLSRGPSSSPAPNGQVTEQPPTGKGSHLQDHAQRSPRPPPSPPVVPPPGTMTLSLTHFRFTPIFPPQGQLPKGRDRACLAHGCVPVPCTQPANTRAPHGQHETRMGLTRPHRWPQDDP